MRFFLFFLILFNLSASQIEFFFDCEWDAKGRIAGIEELAPDNFHLSCFLQSKLKENGHELRRWEIDAYRPFLLTWAEVKNFNDFKHYLGFGLPRKDPVLPETKYWMFWNLGCKIKDFDFSKVAKE